MTFPRVLFLTPCAFNAVTGGGVTFTNLFRGWPADRLATITDDRVPVSRDVCQQYYFLGDDELRYAAPFHWLRRRTANPSALVHNQAGVPAGPPSRWESLARKVLGTAGLPDRGRLSPALRRWLDRFRPEVVYTILGSEGYFDLLEAICRYTAAPFVLHVMDHGTIDPERTGLFGDYRRRTIRRRTRHLVNQAAQCLAIGEQMAEEYSRTFARPFKAFQNTIDLDRCPAAVLKPPDRSRPARLVYVGSILPYAVLDGLRDCCRAVAELRRTGMNIRLEIHTPLELFGKDAAELPIPEGGRVCDVPRTDEAFFAVLQQADALLLPVNFDRASVGFIRLSMPTKVPAYLASGVPVLVYGPPTVAQVAYARRWQWAQVVDRQSLPLLQDGIRQVLLDHQLRWQLSRASRDAARRFHDAGLVRAAFQKTLIEAGRATASGRRAA